MSNRQDSWFWILDDKGTFHSEELLSQTSGRIGDASIYFLEESMIGEAARKDEKLLMATAVVLLTEKVQIDTKCPGVELITKMRSMYYLSVCLQGLYG